MPRSTVTGLFVITLAGAGLVGYLVLRIPPWLADGSLNLTALLPFLLGVFLAVTGATGILSLALSRRWPALAGRLALSARSSVEQARRRARAGIRQGVLAGSGAVILLVLAVAGWLDLAIALVVVMLTGLIESFMQSREV